MSQKLSDKKLDTREMGNCYTQRCETQKVNRHKWIPTLIPGITRYKNTYTHKNENWLQSAIFVFHKQRCGNVHMTKGKLAEKMISFVSVYGG